VTGDTNDMKVKRSYYDLDGWYLPARYTEEDAPAPEYVGEIKYEYTYTPDADGNISPDFDADSTENKTVKVAKLTDENGKEIIDNLTDRPLYARIDGEGKTVEGDAIKEYDVIMVCSDEVVVNSETDNKLTIKKDSDIIVCAKWLRRAQIEYILKVTDENGNVIEDVEFTQEGTDKKYKSGDVLIKDSMAGDGETPANRERVAIEGLTFVRTYMNEELTQNVEYIERPKGLGETVPPVYCRYIVGDWTVISSTDTSKVRQMFNTLHDENRKFLLLDDVVYSGDAIALKRDGQNNARSAATIVCNGGQKTISNLKFAITTTIGNRFGYSIFGSIEGSFKILGGLTLKNVSVSIPSSDNEFNFYAVCYEAAPAAAANMDLTIETVTATYAGSSDKINDGDLSHWLFGGAASDEAFLAGFAGIKLSADDNSTISQAQQ
ncbi:MAG: hypothetical protein K2N47_05620, partial [Clostridia bacterium]|nr:hypothetical protein [Clostridia bacterium]